jgi:DNA ligase-1
MDDIKNHFKAVRSEGQEGVVVKNYRTIWKDGTSKDQLKVKVVAEADLYITGWNPGEGKNQGLVGSVIARSSDDKVEVAISGFTDEMRRKITAMIDQLIETSQIITVKFNDLIADENTDMLSLFLPRFVELRKDKQGKAEADSLNRIHHILENFELFSSV